MQAGNRVGGRPFDTGSQHVATVLQETLVGILDLSESFGGERAKLDVHQLAVAKVRERDAIGLGLELWEKSPLSPDAVAADRLGANPAVGKPLEHRLGRFAGRSTGPGRRRL